MPLHVSYDVTRLLTRLFGVTPNGIDRIDAGLAVAFLDRLDSSGFLITPLGPRLLTGATARAAVAGLATHWGEDATAKADPAYRDLVAWLMAPAVDRGVCRVVAGRPHAAALQDWLRLNSAALPNRPMRALPYGARYLNTSQFPLWMRAPFAWLEARPDVKAAFFIHDLLPLERPDDFRAGEPGRHRQRLETLARFGAGAIVTSEPVRVALARHLASRGRAMPILVAPPAPASVFTRPDEIDPRLAATSYFVCCATLEPRKNHMLLLNVWQGLVAGRGDHAPRLVLVGARGWKFGPVVDLLRRCPALRAHVVEVAGLTTPGLRRLLAGAKALLMPTFAEGYGLPVHEALASGVPVVASDIDAFRGLADPLLTRLDPHDQAVWSDAIERIAREARPYRRAPAPDRAGQAGAAIEAFLRDL